MNFPNVWIGSLVARLVKLFEASFTSSLASQQHCLLQELKRFQLV